MLRLNLKLTSIILLSCSVLFACSTAPRQTNAPAPPTSRYIPPPSTAPATAPSTVAAYLAVANDAKVIPFIGNSVHIRIEDRVSHLWLPILERNGTYYIAGKPNSLYAINLRSNQDKGKVLTVLSVDGLNTITSEPASTNQRGYVLAPRSQYDISAWRKQERDSNTFSFARVQNNTSQTSQRGNNLGIIALAVFQEYLAPTQGTKTSNVLNRTPASYLESSPTGQTQFIRAQVQPNELIQLRYDSIENLIQIGLLQWVYPNSPAADKRLTKFTTPSYNLSRDLIPPR